MAMHMARGVIATFSLLMIFHVAMDMAVTSFLMAVSTTLTGAVTFFLMRVASFLLHLIQKSRSKKGEY